MASEAITIAPGLAPAAPLMRLLSRFDRAKVEAFAEVRIALLDLIDGDPDLEPEEDKGEEERGEQGGWGNGIDQRGLTAGVMAWHCDDCEDDDPAGGAIDDEPHDPMGDYDSGQLINGGGSDGDLLAGKVYTPL